MEYHGISRILGSKALTKRDNRFGLVLREIVHMDVFSLSSHKVWGILDIS